MRKFTVARVGGTDGWAAFDMRGKQVTCEFEHKEQAYLYGSHWAHAPSLQKQLKLRKIDGIIQGRPFYCTQVAIYKDLDRKWKATVNLEDAGQRQTRRFRTKQQALEWVQTFGSTKVPTKNILNPEAGTILINRSEKGGCTDPGTERYHCM